MALLLEETPVYRMVNNGTAALVDVELIAAIIGGNAAQAQNKAQKVINHVGTLVSLAQTTRLDLQTLGLTEMEAVRVIAALEIGRRRQLTPIDSRPRIAHSRDAYNCIGPLLNDLQHEEFWILVLNKANEVIDRTRISSGGMAGTVVDLKIMMREAVLRKGAALIMVHNHPSGNLQPSQADIDLTRKAKQAGTVMDMPVLDHLIIAGGSAAGYYSFADEGMI